jgi:CheY-like chemotaxis protein
MVLLVEAAQDDRAMYAEYLRLSGFEAIETDDTGEALKRAARADVIVTGVRLPGPFDGIELVTRLRQRNSTSHKGVIVLTACAFKPEEQRSRAAGCDAFLPKPCSPDLLAAEIRRVLSVRSGSPSGAVGVRVAARRRRRRAG